MWSVRYNHFHDQLVLTSSSDSRVVLHNAASVSSEPYGHLLDEEDEEIDDDTDLKERFVKILIVLYAMAIKLTLILLS